MTSSGSPISTLWVLPHVMLLDNLPGGTCQLQHVAAALVALREQVLCFALHATL